MACVIHWRPWLGSRRFVVALAAAAAGLRGEARRRVACSPSQYGKLGARDSWSLCEARASQCGACAGLRSTAGCSPRRARGAAAALHRHAGVLRPRARVRAYKLAQKDQGLGRVLTAHGKGWGLGAATPAAGLSGGSRTALAEVGAAGRSGLLGSADRLVVRLRRCTNGQGGRSIHSGEKSRWRSHLPAVVLGVESGACRALGRGRRARGETWGSGGAISGVVEARGAVEGRVRGGAELLRRRGRVEGVARVWAWPAWRMG